MKNIKLFALLFLSLNSFAVFAVNAQADLRPTRPGGAAFRVLAEGANSGVEQPFVFIARSPDAYAQLRTLAPSLPIFSEIDFDRSAVVAAFAGTKRTGGWTVNIKAVGSRVAVDDAGPTPDMMVTQALTTPFKIVLVPVESDKTLNLRTSANWTSKMKTYIVSAANFEFSGGFAPMRRKFAAQGTIQVLTYNNLVTFNFYLTGRAAERNRRLSDIASGIVTAGNVLAERVDAGNFVDNPHPPFKASGTIDNRKLSLTFESLPTRIADGYSGSGKLEAVRVR